MGHTLKTRKRGEKYLTIHSALIEIIRNFNPTALAGHVRRQFFFCDFIYKKSFNVRL